MQRLPNSMPLLLQNRCCLFKTRTRGCDKAQKWQGPFVAPLLSFSALAALLFTSCGLAKAETVEFNSLNRQQTFAAVLEGRAQYSDKISGVFTRPDSVTADVPVIIIMHGSGGKSDIGTGMWSNYFLDMGIATFVVDSFGPRGFLSTAADQSQLSYAASSVDALTALQAVVKLPGVDASRIGVIGFSRGGVAASNSAYLKVRSAVLGDKDKLNFAFHVVLYGGCSQPGTTTGKPILFLMGDDDDYITVKTCTDFVDLLRNRGANIEFVVYPNTKHGFDQDRNPVHAARAQTWKSCEPRYMDLDDLTYSINGLRVSAKEFGDTMGACMTTGVTVGPNYVSRDAARAAVKSFVRKNFAM